MKEVSRVSWCHNPSAYLAEGLHQGVQLAQLMPGDHGEEVVVHLVAQATAEPLHEGVTLDVAGGGHLKGGNRS